MRNAQPDAVIFDLDGLVLDTESTYFQAWQSAAAEIGFELDQAFCNSLSGHSGHGVRQRLQTHYGPAFDTVAFQRLSGVYWHAHVRQHGIAVKTGFFALLAVLRDKGLAYALATNSRLSDARHCLAFAGLHEVFSCIVAGDDVVNAKPAPDIFLRAATDLAYPISRCLVLEDSAIGVRAAKAAGATCILVPSLRPVDSTAAEQADYIMDDLQQVADFISALPPHPL